MNTLTIVLMTFVAAAAFFGVIMAYVQYKKKGGVGVPFDKIVPIVAEALVEMTKIQEAQKLGFDALETYAVNFIKGQIDSATFLTDEEKAVFTTNIIRSFIDPQLKKLFP